MTAPLAAEQNAGGLPRWKCVAYCTCQRRMSGHFERDDSGAWVLASDAERLAKENEQLRKDKEINTVNAKTVEDLRAKLTLYQSRCAILAGFVWDRPEGEPMSAGALSAAIADAKRAVATWPSEVCRALGVPVPEKTEAPRKTRYCDYDLCAATFDPAHSNNDH